MTKPDDEHLEIESFNLSDLNVTAMDVRLELTSLMPSVIICEGNACPSNCSSYCGHDCTNNCTAHCYSNSCGTHTGGCEVHDPP